MIVAITNLKGGVGKTTIATNLAVELVRRGQQVCIIDTDLGQQSSMEWSGARAENLPRVPVFGIGVKQLNKEAEDLRKRFDAVIIDGSPQLSELADRTILASDAVIIPLSPSIYDFRGFENFLQRFEQIKGSKEAMGGSVRAFVLLNRVVPNTNVSREIEEAVRAYEIEMLQTRIAHRISYVETATQGLGVVEARDPKARQEIESLADEILELLKKA